MTRRRILLPLLLAALFCACAPSRRTAAVHSRAENDLRMQVLREELSTRDSLFFRALCEELIRNLDGERHLHRVVGEEVETVTREYDTSRPVDTLTGTPPLRRETIQRRRLTDSTHEADRVRQTEHRIQADTILGGGHARQQLRTEGNTSRQEAAETARELQKLNTTMDLQHQKNGLDFSPADVKRSDKLRATLDQQQQKIQIMYGK